MTHLLLLALLLVVAAPAGAQPPGAPEPSSIQGYLAFVDPSGGSTGSCPAPGAGCR